MPEESTTPDLVERWRQAAEAAYRGDLGATMGIFAPDAVWEVQPLGISHRGAPAIRSFLEDWLGSYENYEDDQEAGLDLGNGVVFVVSQLDARPVGSRGKVQERWSFTVLWVAGVVVRVTGRNDIDEARAAAERLAEERAEAMSQESTTPDLVELSRRAIESVVRGDFDAAMSSYGPDSVWDTSPLGMGTYRGVAAIRKAFEEWFGPYEETQAEIEEIVNVGNGVILAVVRQRGRPAGSSGYVQFCFASVTEWTRGVVARVTPYSDIDEARAAAERLAESRWETMSQERIGLVRRSVQAFNDRDIPALESIYSEDVVFRLVGGFADLMGTEFRGQDAVLTWMRDWVDTIGGRAEIETLREVDDRVLAIATVVTAGTLSGTPATLRYGQVYSFRDGRISAFDSYYTADEALEAVGMRE